MEVLNEDIAFLDKFGENFLAVGGLCVESEGFFVGVELEEVIAGLIGEEL